MRANTGGGTVGDRMSARRERSLFRAALSVVVCVAASECRCGAAGSLARGWDGTVACFEGGCFASGRLASPRFSPSPSSGCERAPATPPQRNTNQLSAVQQLLTMSTTSGATAAPAAAAATSASAAPASFGFAAPAPTPPAAAPVPRDARALQALLAAHGLQPGQYQSRVIAQLLEFQTRMSLQSDST